MDKRSEVQYEALKAWIDNNKIGTIVLGTGFGKTKIGVTAVGEQLKNKSINNALIVVPTVPLMNHWIREFKEWGYDEQLDNVTILCIQTAYKIEGRFDLVVVDEIHTTLSPKYRTLYSLSSYSQLMGLTATPPHQEEYREFLQLTAKIVYHKDVEYAVDIKAVSEYTIYNLEVKMSRKDRGRYQIFDKSLKRAQMELGIIKRYDKDLKVKTIFDIAKEYSNSKENNNLVKYSKQFWSSMSMRKWVCYEAESKKEVVVNIINKFPTRKWIIFNKSIKYAEELQKMIPESAIYHSKMNHKEREKVLEDFENNIIKRLIAVDALNAGLNIPDTDSAICVSGVSTELTQIQQLGRVQRRTDDNKHSVFINLFSKDTIEESWVEKKTKNLKNTYWITTLNQIK